MDWRIGENRRVTMKDIQDVCDKLQDNPFYREFLIHVRNEIGDQYYSVMEEPPPRTITAKVPRMKSGTSGGGVIALRPGAAGTTYL